MDARGTRMVRPFTAQVPHFAGMTGGQTPPRLIERRRRQAASAGTYHTGAPASFSNRKSVRAASRTTSMCSSIKRDERQEQRAVEPVLVKLVRRHVRGRHHDDAELEQAFEQAPENHGVGNVGDVEFVEAEKPGLLRNVGRGEPDRVLVAELRRFHALPERVDALVHVGHEFVEMDAALAHRPATLAKNRSISMVLPRPTSPKT